MKTKKTQIAVVIANYNGNRFIKPCLDSLLRSAKVSFEIILIDDASTDTSRKTLKKYERYKNIRILYSNKNRGLAQSNNLGAKKTKAPYILFLNVDTKVKKYCLSEVVKKFDQDEKVGVIQIKLVKGNGTIDTVGHFMSITGFPYDIAQGHEPKKYEKEMVVFGAKNAGLAVRKNLFERAGAFDKNYVIYGEDTDLCWRSWKMGYKTVYLPTAESYHFEGSSITKKTSYRIFYEGSKNNLNYILKDAPFPLILIMLPLHVILWFFLAARLLFDRPSLSLWILKGLVWNITNLPATLQMRKKISRFTKNSDYTKSMFGSMSFYSLFTKGYRWITGI